MISKEEYIKLHKRLGQQAQDKEMFTLTLSNTHSTVKTAEMFSNKGGFSGNATIIGYDENETIGWVNDFPNDGLTNGRIIGLVFNPTIGKFVVFKNGGTHIVKIYILNFDNTYTIQATLDLSANPVTGAIQVVYSSVNQQYYIAGNGPSSRLRIHIVESNFTLGSNVLLTTGTHVLGEIGVNEVTGEIFFTNGFGTDFFAKYNPNTLASSSVNIPSVAGGYALKGVVYDSISNKYFMITQGTPKSEIFVVDGTTNAQTLMYEYSYNSGGELAIIDNKLFVIVNDGSNMLLQKFNTQTETLISSRTIKENVITGFHILTDNKKNFYLLTNQNLEGFDVDGNKIFDYSTNSRNSSISNGNLFLGGNEMKVPSNQFFNPLNDTFLLNGTPATQGGTVWVMNPNYVGGLNDFDIETSANNYTSANTDYNINPITVSSMTLFYKNGGVSLNNSLHYSYNSATGKEVRKLINPKSYLDVTGGDDKIIEIEFQQPIIIDSKHFFKVDLQPSEQITFAFFYKQANISDILTNKFFLK